MLYSNYISIKIFLEVTFLGYTHLKGSGMLAFYPAAWLYQINVPTFRIKENLFLDMFLSKSFSSLFAVMIKGY